LLLQWDSKECDAPDLVAHNLQEVVNIDPFLNIVGEVEVSVVEEIVVRLCLYGDRANDEGKDNRHSHAKAQRRKERRAPRISLRVCAFA
jgi:hypothetical protein